MMREATLKHGLRFGVTTHSDRAINWMQPAHGADKEGEFTGVPYITNDPRYHDLYLLKYYDGNRADPEDAPTFWKQYWLLRMKEMFENYRPDFVYLDSAVPFAGSDHGRTGMEMMAHYYNANMSWHDGQLEGVLTHKGDKGPKRAPYFPNIATLDIERGMSREIREQPWQTDDSTGPWGYNSTVPYKDPNAVIDKMIDTVSKNGNYLLNVPPKADGSLDQETIDILERVGQWFAINGEGIYATRPWKVFGEGPATRMGDRADRSPYTPENIRFTQSKDGNVIFAIQMAPSEAGSELLLTSFGEEGPGADADIRSVELVGSAERVTWLRAAAGLKIISPAKAPDELAVVYRIRKR
jgi:alpha-L-fucosidase